MSSQTIWPLRIRGFAFSTDAPPRPLVSFDDILGARADKQFVWLDAEGKRTPLPPPLKEALEDSIK